MPHSDRSSPSAPRLDLRVPSTAAAWERVRVTIAVSNGADAAILPISLVLSSGRRELASWGLHGRSTRWGVLVPGRVTTIGLEVLATPDLHQQSTAPPSAAENRATAQLVRVEPIWPEAVDQVSTDIDATYEHGEQLDARLEYILLDPASRRICAAQQPADAAPFVACRPVEAVRPPGPGLQLYLLADELDRGRQTVIATAAFTIRHPSFDIDAARANARVASGPFGYDRTTGQWILVDGPGARTRLVGEQETVEDLPGQWLTLFEAIAHAGEATVGWDARSVPLADEDWQALSDAGIDVGPFKHKGSTSPTHVVLSIDRGQVTALAGVLLRIGARLDELQVVR